MLICKMLEGIVQARDVVADNPMNGMEYLELSFIEAQFIVDFGPWKAGEKPYSLRFDPIRGMITEGNCWGDLLRSCQVDLRLVQGSEKDYRI